MWDSHDGMGWWMLWVSVVWLIFMVAIVIVGARSFGDRRHPDNIAVPRPEPPLDIARRRYASGELSSEEFEEIRRTLS